MINRKSREDLKRMRHAGHIVALVHQKMKEVVEPGISTKELDDIAYHVIRENKAIPTFLGYNGFPASICTSINEQVVHGIPHENIKVKEGDIISIDVGATYAGFVGDSAWTYPVGIISDELQKLLKTTEENYFFRLSKYKDAIIKHIKENPDFIVPAFRANEVINQLEDIQDISVSRAKTNVHR